ncbi:hypothetical protein AB6A40_003769 [Gnathostoma spinigerum]|uniref:Symplekin n=1 Tax=Gnathostoma spinigerum TaxID=75299 RepID=A0ABD6EAJ7_9BILA
MMSDHEERENEDLSNEIGHEIHEAQQIGLNIDERIRHLRKAEELLINRNTSGSLLDNFLDEMLEFVVENDAKMRCFIASFIEKACKKDCEVMKKAVVSLSYLLEAGGRGAITVIKKVIMVCSQLYPYVLKWAVTVKGSETERCWEAFSIVKGRIMQFLDSDNEGIRTQTIKFLEAVVLSQTIRPEDCEKSSTDHMCLNEIGRDHRFISYRKMESEAILNFTSLLDQLSSPHISSLNLLTCLSSICKIAHQRPQHMQRVVGVLESLQVNLPPTLATSQVKSVRKELKMHLLRLLKHPSSTSLHQRITTLLTDLGASQSEVLRSLPSSSDVRKKAPLKTTQGADEPDKKRVRLEENETTQAAAEKEDDEEYGDESSSGLSSTGCSNQAAIDITAQFVFERLKPRVVTNLVLISLVTLPDEMPAAFQSSYTPIAAAGTESQIRHLSRMMATQFTSLELGPGVEKMRSEKRKQFIARQAARLEGAIIPPTPQHEMSTSLGTLNQYRSEPHFAQPTFQLPLPKGKQKVQFSLLTITKELDRNEAKRLIMLAFERILANEKRAVQGGAGIAQQKLLVRLVARFEYDNNDEFVDLLTEFIIREQKSRTDLALLWIAELYAQFHGYSIRRTPFTLEGCYPERKRYESYDMVLCKLLRTLFERGEHKETLFHKILLEAPHLTTQSLTWLKAACLDPVFGAFGMTTLRELVMTRSRQRNELLCLLLDFAYSDRSDVRNQSIETARELYQLDYMRNDVRDYLICAIEFFVLPTPPPQISDHLPNESGSQWNEITIRAGLNLFLAILPVDHSLIHNLASVYAKSSNDIKKVILHSVDSAVRAMGATSENLLDMIEKCPVGAETLAARVVHLLTERNPPTPILVERIKGLYDQGRTDVRSLIPVLNGLDKEQIMKVLPTFVLNVQYQRAVPAVFSKLLSGRNIKTGLPSMGGGELIVVLHRIPTKNEVQQKLLSENIDLLIAQLSGVKDYIASAVDVLLDDDPMPTAVFHTIARCHESYPALSGFIANVMLKILKKRPWEKDKDLFPHVIDCVLATAPHSYMGVLTAFSKFEFTELSDESEKRKINLVAHLKSFISSLSAHQQKKVDRELKEIIFGSDATPSDSSKK